MKGEFQARYEQSIMVIEHKKDEIRGLRNELSESEAKYMMMMAVARRLAGGTAELIDALTDYLKTGRATDTAPDGSEGQ